MEEVKEEVMEEVVQPWFWPVSHLDRKEGTWRRFV